MAGRKVAATNGIMARSAIKLDIKNQTYIIMDTIQGELNLIEKRMREGGSADELQDRIRDVFKKINTVKEATLRAEERARDLLLNITRKGTAVSEARSENYGIGFFVNAIIKGDRRALALAEEEVGETEGVVAGLARAILAQADNHFENAAISAQRVANESSGDLPIAMLAQILELRAELGRETQEKSKGLARSIQEEGADKGGDDARKATECVVKMIELAKKIERGTALEKLGRLIVAEALFVIGRLDAASITLRPIMEDELFGEAANYLEGKIQYSKRAGKAMARAAWIRSGETRKTRFGKWAREAVEALGEMKEPELHGLLEF